MFTYARHVCVSPIISLLSNITIFLCYTIVAISYSMQRISISRLVGLFPWKKLASVYTFIHKYIIPKSYCEQKCLEKYSCLSRTRTQAELVSRRCFNGISDGCIAYAFAYALWLNLNNNWRLRKSSTWSSSSTMLDASNVIRYHHPQYHRGDGRRRHHCGSRDGRNCISCHPNCCYCYYTNRAPMSYVDYMDCGGSQCCSSIGNYSSSDCLYCWVICFSNHANHWLYNQPLSLHWPSHWSYCRHWVVSIWFHLI